MATSKLIQALNIDPLAYTRGLHRMGLWEGVHSSVGRGIACAGYGLAVAAAPALQALSTSTASSAALRFAGKNLPASLINPIVTGCLRIDTDVRKSIDNGGISKLPKNIEAAPPIRTIRHRMQRQNAVLRKCIADYRNAVRYGSPINLQTSQHRAQLRALCAAFEEANAAQHAYKVRLGAGKAQTWSKGYGMAVNALATGAQVAGLVFPPAAPASLGVQALCLPLQIAAG